MRQDLFYDKMMADPRVNYFFEGIDMKKQRAHQVRSLDRENAVLPQQPLRHIVAHHLCTFSRSLCRFLSGPDNIAALRCYCITE